jgi:hypothetical protein
MVRFHFSRALPLNSRPHYQGDSDNTNTLVTFLTFYTARYAELTWTQNGRTPDGVSPLFSLRFRLTSCLRQNVNVVRFAHLYVLCSFLINSSLPDGIQNRMFPLLKLYIPTNVIRLGEKQKHEHLRTFSYRPP